MKYQVGFSAFGGDSCVKVSVYPKIDYYFCQILDFDVSVYITLSSFNFKKFCEKRFLLDKVIKGKRFYE